MSLSLKKAEKDEVYIIQALLESQPDFLQLEGRNVPLEENQLLLEYFSNDTESYFVMLDETFIGFCNVKKKHIVEGCASIGMLCLYKDYEGFGFASGALALLEDNFSKEDTTKIRISLLEENVRAVAFFEREKYNKIEKRTWQSKQVIVMEKTL